MRKATVNYVVRNSRLAEKKYGHKTVHVPDEMFYGWNWDGIVKEFKAQTRTRFRADDWVAVTSIRLGRTTLVG
jgi:hypothetical protein